MTAYRARLTDHDIRRLVKSDVEDERASAAHKLCRNLGRVDLSETERAAAQKIIRVMAQDAAELVRRALAITLKSSELIPRDVARRLAHDVDSVALPIIRFSPALSDDDLIEVIRGGSTLSQVAVAERERLGREVCHVLAAEAGRLAVLALAANDNADLVEAGLEAIIERFGRENEVVATLAQRSVLPLSITERLVGMASDTVRKVLIERYRVQPQDAVQLSQYARERATIDLIDQAVLADDLPGFVAHLHSRNVLKPSILLRALVRGQMGFLEHGVSALAATPHNRVAIMIHDAGPLGLRAIYDRAGLPPRLFAAFRAGVDVWRALHNEGATVDSPSFGMKMLARFLSQKTTFSAEDMAYLLERIDTEAEYGQPKPSLLPAMDAA